MICGYHYFWKHPNGFLFVSAFQRCIPPSSLLRQAPSLRRMPGQRRHPAWWPKIAETADTPKRQRPLKRQSSKQPFLCVLGNYIDPRTQLILVLIGKDRFFLDLFGGFKPEKKKIFTGSRRVVLWWDPGCHQQPPILLTSERYLMVIYRLFTTHFAKLRVQWRPQTICPFATECPFVSSYWIMVPCAALRSGMLLGHDFALDGLSTLLPGCSL